MDVCPKLCSSIILTFPLNVLLQGWIHGEKCVHHSSFFILQLSSKFCNTKAQFSHGSSPTHFLKSVCLICDERCTVCTAHPRQKPFPRLLRAIIFLLIIKMDPILCGRGRNLRNQYAAAVSSLCFVLSTDTKEDG